ncbi:hypothetical protein BKA82DRAFT_2972677 [Pisolithus tinctorius]|nr:hypothetical protein BKA82DRAFT_2972677 [Pisolithus tinctorius]
MRYDCIGALTIDPMASSTIFTLKYSKHPELYIDTVTFLVENCLFKIPRKPLEEESAVFRDMFRLPQPKNKMMEGQNDARPLVLHGVSKDDFDAC